MINIVFISTEWENNLSRLVYSCNQHYQYTKDTVRGEFDIVKLVGYLV